MLLDILGSLHHHLHHRHHHLENQIIVQQRLECLWGRNTIGLARKGDISFVGDNSDIYTKPGMICPVVR